MSRRTHKTYVITRVDQFLYLVGLAVAGLMNLVFANDFFLSFKLFFLCAVALTLIRDWKTTWITFTTDRSDPSEMLEGNSELSSKVDT